MLDYGLLSADFRARTLPVYLSINPAVLLLAALVPDGLKLPLEPTMYLARSFGQAN